MIAVGANKFSFAIAKFGEHIVRKLNYIIISNFYFILYFCFILISSPLPN